MRSLLPLIALLVLLSPICSSECEAVERTAYLFRADDRTLVSVPVPAPDSGVVFPTIIENFDWSPTGSTLTPDGRILTMNPDTDELVAVTPTTGAVEILSVLSVDISPYADLFLGIDGSLMGFFQGEIHHIDPDTGTTTLQATVDEDIEVITLHEGQYYGWGGFRFWKIDPQTFEVTLVVEYPPAWGTGMHGWGLTSVGGELWTGISIFGMPPVFDTFIDTMDPFTGQGVSYVRLLGDEIFTALEVVEQPGPAAVPTLQRVGLLIFILTLMIVGVLGLWRM